MRPHSAGGKAGDFDKRGSPGAIATLRLPKVTVVHGSLPRLTGASQGLIPRDL